MAYTPKGAIALPNPVGTAPGSQLKREKTLIICLPGVPAEMQAIFKKYVYNNLAKLSGQAQHRVSINVQGIDEATLAPFLKRLTRKFRGLDVRSYPSGKGIKGRIRVLLVAPTAAEVEGAKETLNKWLSDLRLSSSH
jgi:molybdopterin-biosynthesis enzyme MoeA-like protein